LSRLRRALRAVAVDADLLRRRRELRLLMIGQGVSLLGSSITLVAIPVQMYDETGSTVAVGLVGATQFVSIVSLALHLNQGHLVNFDRLEWKYIRKPTGRQVSSEREIATYRTSSYT